MNTDKAVGAERVPPVFREDVPILLAAMKAKVDYLVTFNRVHFMDDPEISVRSGLRIGMPGEALDWVRKKMEEENG